MVTTVYVRDFQGKLLKKGASDMVGLLSWVTCADPVGGGLR